MQTGIFVIGMNLHGKLFPWEDELYKQGNARASLQPAPFPVGRKPAPRFAERAPREGAGGKSARISREPDLPNRFASRRRAVK